MSDEIRRLYEQPEKIQDDPHHYHWTCPAGYKHPSCDACGKTFFKMEPRPSIGNASVPSGVLCWECTKELNA